MIFKKFRVVCRITRRGIRRFCGCDKGTRSVPATAKMWWRKNPPRALARLGFFVARAAVRRRSVYRVLCDVKPSIQLIHTITILYFLFRHIFASCLFLLFFLPIPLTDRPIFLFFFRFPFPSIFLLFRYFPLTIL